MKRNDSLTGRIIACAIEVHRTLGPGLLESAYARCLSHEFGLSGIAHQMEVYLPVEYKGIRIDCGYRIDAIVEPDLVDERRVIIELKVVDELLGIHEAQLLTYMKLAKISTGLLINFHVPLLKDGIRRFVL